MVLKCGRPDPLRHFHFIANGPDQLEFPELRIKRQRRGNSSPYSAATVFLLALCSSCFLRLHPFSQRLLRAEPMGKRSSSATDAATGAAPKKAKTADADASVIGRWVQTKVGDKELSQTEKMGLLKNTPAESLAAGPEIIPWPPRRFRVIFIAFLLRGLSLPPHPFLRGLLFAYGI
jgi:hypothetical protein